MSVPSHNRHLPPSAFTFGWRLEQLPCATSIFDREISLPLFPSMSPDQVEAVLDAVAETVNVRSSAREATV